MIVRTMLPADLDRVLAIADSLAQAPRWPRAIYEAALTPGSAPQRVLLVAEEPGPRIVGFVVASVVQQEAELETIGVAADRQRQGVGGALLREATHLLAEQGVTQVLLEVRESNAAAQQLYRSAGFETIGRRSSYYVDPKEDAILMSISIRERILPQAGSDSL